MFCSLQVDGEDKYERIGGTSTGGGTFWGLGSLLTDAKVAVFITYMQCFKYEVIKAHSRCNRKQSSFSISLESPSLSVLF